MLQPPLNAPVAPTPQSQRGNDLGQTIKSAVESGVGEILSGVREGMAEGLVEARTKRGEIQAQLDRNPSAAGRAELRQEAARLDRQIADLERGLSKLDGRLATNNAPRIATTTPPFQPVPFDRFNPAPMVISIMAILFIGFPLALTFARLLWRRASHTTPPALNVETSRRFDRLEQSVDAIAIEVERISENQRYLTKLLAEPKHTAVGTGPTH